ncbi:MAG: peptidase S41, partial [Clostridium sp.]|uniref:peptidase S41 n=1 Tax=Clostridium sp. TaxID=1506 RepID=UPI003EE67A6E
KLIEGHKNLFFNVTEDRFNEMIDKLKSDVDMLEYDDMKVELSRIAAAICDAHTGVVFPVSTYLPVRFYIFEDGVYIINVSKDYEELLYKKVDCIQGISIDEVLMDISTIVSHENEFLLKAQSAKYLQAVDVLYGLCICDSKEEVMITVEGKEVSLKAVSMQDLCYMECAKLPRYARDNHINYWFERVNDELYIKYNSCREDGVESLSEKINKTIDCILKNNTSKVTIDLRNNLGGDSTLIRPLIDFLKGNEEINKKENLKVIIGRETFSSALLNAYEFKFSTNAEIIGEPSGGKPNCYGEILKFTLPNSKFIVSYSTKYYKLIEDDTILALYPDRNIYESIDEYI